MTRYFLQFSETSGVWGYKVEIKAENDDVARAIRDLYDWTHVRIIKRDETYSEIEL